MATKQPRFWERHATLGDVMVIFFLAPLLGILLGYLLVHFGTK